MATAASDCLSHSGWDSRGSQRSGQLWGPKPLGTVAGLLGAYHSCQNKFLSLVGSRNSSFFLWRQTMYWTLFFHPVLSYISIWLNMNRFMFPQFSMLSELKDFILFIYKMRVSDRSTVWNQWSQVTFCFINLILILFLKVPKQVDKTMMFYAVM